jgi:hypothetical protein
MEWSACMGSSRKVGTEGRLLSKGRAGGLRGVINREYLLTHACFKALLFLGAGG